MSGRSFLLLSAGCRGVPRRSFAAYLDYPKMRRLDELWREVLDRTDYERCERPRAARFSLDGMQALIGALGDPQGEVPVIHIAGSKGKGTVAHYLERALRAAEFRTGLYTSPHLSHWRERIRLNGIPVDEATASRALEPVLAAAPDDATFFDLLTAAAFAVFRATERQVWIVEVGLGGRFDSTNVVRPWAAAVTSIEREHTDVLGSDLGDIAEEKAGIFKAGARLWSALPREHAARPVLVEAAAARGEELQELLPEAVGRPDLPQPQPHMQRNFALARALLSDLATRDLRFGIAAREIDELPASDFVLPGRWEERRLGDGRLAVFDTAHTEDSLRATLAAFRALHAGRSRGVVLALRQEKDLASLVAAVGSRPPEERWWVAPAGDHPRSADPREIAPAFGAEVLEKPALPDGPDVLLITGSTYLVGALRPRTSAALA